MSEGDGELIWSLLGEKIWPVRLEGEKLGYIEIRDLKKVFLGEGDAVGGGVACSIEERHEREENGFVGRDHDIVLW